MLDIERHKAVNNFLNAQNTQNQKSFYAIAALYVQLSVGILGTSLHIIIRIWLIRKKSVMNWVDVMTID